MLELAIIGTPNSGKSTMFKAATLKDVKIANYPFTTLEPNEGLAHVTTSCPCTELGLTCESCKNGLRFVPVKLWDVAGLVPDAHLGRGRGNAFLDDLMQAAAFIHVIDISGRTDLEGNSTENFDSAEAIKMLERELDYWLLGLIKKDWNAAKSQHNAIELFAKRLSGLGITKNDIKLAMEKFDLTDRIENWSDADTLNFVSLLRKHSKPSIIAANKIDIRDEGNLENLKERFPEKTIYSTSAEIELALREAAQHGLINYIPGDSDFTLVEKNKITEKQAAALSIMKKFLQQHGHTNVQQVLNTAVFSLLNMIAVFPVENETKFSDKKGRILPDCFLMKKGSTAVNLAYQVHEDIGRKFISAINARTKRTVSADYELQHSDIISIKSGR